MAPAPGVAAPTRRLSSGTSPKPAGKETERRFGPKPGVKGVGELGTIGATPCVVNAIADALARNGHAKRCAHLQMPLTPARLWEALQAAG